MNTLVKYLRLNSAFSLFSGLVMVSMSGALNLFFNIDNPWVFPIIGLNLIVFALFVWYVSYKYSGNKLLVNIISTLDALWVIGSIVLIFINPFEISTNGILVIAAVAIWIGFLGLKQYQYNKRP